MIDNEMTKIVVINIKPSRLDRGYTASLQIFKIGCLPLDCGEADLPDISDIDSYYILWQAQFRGLSLRSSHDDDWQLEPKTTTNRSTLAGSEACRRYARLVEEKMQAWLRNSIDRQWQDIREKLVRELVKPEEEIHVVIKSDPALWKLPWHRWDLLEAYPDIGVSISLSQKLDREEVSTILTRRTRVRILAIFGDDTNIDLQPDRQAISDLKDADIKFLDKPKASELIEQVRDKEGWDILFFAGHSETKEQSGRIYINETEYLEINYFRNSLKEAISRGLKIAIFNSCEGVGLVEEIAMLGIPRVIFMQEKVPDRVAQFFLKEFLSEYATGNSLDSALNRARNRLEQFTELPGVTWLPKLYQNLGDVSPSWKELRGNSNARRIKLSKKLSLHQKTIIFKTIVISLLVTMFVMGTRWFGLLQFSELQAYDRLMQQKAAEPADSRILVVEVNEQDIRQYSHPLPDRTLVQLIEKLEQYKPSVIGLNIYRDLPQEPGHDAIVDYFNTSKNAIAVCKYIADDEGVAPPPVQSLQERQQIGFTNLPLDTPYPTVRRYLLTRSPNAIDKSDPCNTQYSLGFMLAWRYLKAKGVLVNTKANDWYFDRLPLKLLQPHSGGYQSVDSSGNQIILNYRNSPIGEAQIAQSVTVGDILNNRVEPEWLKNKVQGKVVLIGMTASSVRRGVNTPYGEMPGVWIHAHAVSQILSAVENQRPLIRSLPAWGDAIWVWIWSLTGGTLVLVWQLSPRWKSQHLLAGVSLLLAILYGFCSIFFLQGAWLPLIPSALSFLATGIFVAIYFSPPTQADK
jgi:CHASE2 domain-containing sensor protein